MNTTHLQHFMQAVAAVFESSSRRELSRFSVFKLSNGDIEVRMDYIDGTSETCMFSSDGRRISVDPLSFETDAVTKEILDKAEAAGCIVLTR